MLRWIVRVLLFRVLPRRLVPIIGIGEAILLLRSLRRRSARPVVSAQGARSSQGAGSSQGARSSATVGTAGSPGDEAIETA